MTEEIQVYFRMARRCTTISKRRVADQGVGSLISLAPIVVSAFQAPSASSIAKAGRVFRAMIVQDTRAKANFVSFIIVFVYSTDQSVRVISNPIYQLPRLQDCREQALRPVLQF